MSIDKILEADGIEVTTDLLQKIAGLQNRYQFYGHKISKEQIAQYICDYYKNNFKSVESKGGKIGETIIPLEQKNIIKEALYRLDHMKLSAIKKTAKVGRNTPCPCKSGKKYKKCCIDKK